MSLLGANSFSFAFVFTLKNKDDENNKNRQKEWVLKTFGCDGLEPHNRSLEFMCEVLDDVGATIDVGGESRQYDAESFAIRVPGSSGAPYRISVHFRPRAARLMEQRLNEIDFDEDGDQDLYVSGYWYNESILWRNDGFDGNTGLTDVTSAYGASSGPGHTQSSSWADFNNDGHFDLFIGNFAHVGNTTARFLASQGEPGFNFTNKGLSGIVQVEPLSAGIVGDYDNDGHVDLLVTTSGGYGDIYNRLYHNDGNWTFTEVTSSVGLAGLGPGDTAAWGDYNNDGYLDLIADGQLWHNPGGINHWLKVKLLGGTHAKGLVNGSAIRAQVRIEVSGLGILTRQVEGNTGQLGSQNDLTMHFGLSNKQILFDAHYKTHCNMVDPTGAIQLVIEMIMYNSLSFNSSSSRLRYASSAPGSAVRLPALSGRKIVSMEQVSAFPSLPCRARECRRPRARGKWSCVQRRKRRCNTVL